MWDPGVMPQPLVKGELLMMGTADADGIRGWAVRGGDYPGCDYPGCDMSTGLMCGWSWAELALTVELAGHVGNAAALQFANMLRKRPMK